MWQMISSTARNHGVHIQPGYDGRLSPVESTRAALSYLKTLQGMFGDWQAIVMAYNAGEGRILNAFRRARSRQVSAAQRKPHGLSNITYDYVAKLQALSCLVAAAYPDLVRVAPQKLGSVSDLWLLAHPDLVELPAVRAVIGFVTVCAREDRVMLRG